MLQWFKQVQFEDDNGWLFSKGLIKDKGSYTMPIQYSAALKNIRLINGNTTGRKWTITKISSNDGTSIKGIVPHNTGLYVANNSRFLKCNFTTLAFDNVAGGSNSYGADIDANFVVYGQYIILLDGAGFPWVYDTVGDTFTHLTNANIETGANPRFGVTFSRLTLVAGSGTKSNVMYISRWIDPAHPQYCYDWSGNWAEKVIFNSPIVAMSATLTSVYVFTEQTIEIFTKDTITEIGGINASYTIPISSANQPAWPRAVCSADDKVFFLTKNLQIKAINYLPGITSSQVAQVSERPYQSIRGYFDTLYSDQSKAVMIFNKQERTVETHMRGKSSLFNNSTLVYDLINDTFLVDDTKFYSCAAEFDDQIYAGSDLNPSLLLDNDGRDDDGQPINWYRLTKPINFGNQNVRKIMSEIGIVGQISQEGVIYVDVIVDSQTVYTATINGSDYAPWGFASQPMAAVMTAGEGSDVLLQTFEKVIPKSNFYSKGKVMQLLFYRGVAGMQFTLSTVYISVKWLWDVPIQDKI